MLYLLFLFRPFNVQPHSPKAKSYLSQSKRMGNNMCAEERSDNAEGGVTKLPAACGNRVRVIDPSFIFDDVRKNEQMNEKLAFGGDSASCNKIKLDTEAACKVTHVSKRSK